MRSVIACSIACCVTLGLGQSALGQEESCPRGAKALGVARTVSIDTSQGPQFGAQYKEASFLASGEVVLTFDDGPLRAYTRPILEALAAHCTKATFFMVGRMAVADPAMVKEVARQGHTVASHTWSHGNLQGLTPLKARAEIELGISGVQQALGAPIAPFFRFPYLRDTPFSLTYLQGRHLASFSIDVDSKDYLTRDPAVVSERVLRELASRRKGIILFHDIHASTASALPGLLTALKERGLRVVHIAPKAHAETSAEYDALAQKEAERRRFAASDPMAKRAFPWSSSGLSEPARGPSAVTRPHRAPRQDDWITKLWRW